MSATEYTPEIISRFYAKVSTVPTATGCLDWTASRIRGYGCFRVGGKTIYAHRIAWELVFGPIPPGLCALHTCDRPACCNPAHIFIGTRTENMIDKNAKGRGIPPPVRSGERNNLAKLNAAQVLEIRSEKFLGWRNSAIARLFGVTRDHVADIRNRKAWKHI